MSNVILPPALLSGNSSSVQSTTSPLQFSAGEFAQSAIPSSTQLAESQNSSLNLSMHDVTFFMLVVAAVAGFILIAKFGRSSALPRFVAFISFMVGLYGVVLMIGFGLRAASYLVVFSGLGMLAVMMMRTLGVKGIYDSMARKDTVALTLYIILMGMMYVGSFAGMAAEIMASGEDKQAVIANASPELQAIDTQIAALAASVALYQVAAEQCAGRNAARCVRPALRDKLAASKELDALVARRGDAVARVAANSGNSLTRVLVWAFNLPYSAADIVKSIGLALFFDFFSAISAFLAEHTRRRFLPVGEFIGRFEQLVNMGFEPAHAGLLANGQMHALPDNSKVPSVVVPNGSPSALDDSRIKLQRASELWANMSSEEKAAAGGWKRFSGDMLKA